MGDILRHRLSRPSDGAERDLEEKRDAVRTDADSAVIVDLWILAVTALWMFGPGVALALAALGRPSFWVLPAGPGLTILMLAWIGIATSHVGLDAVGVIRLIVAGLTALLAIVAVIRIRLWRLGRPERTRSVSGQRLRVAAATGVAASVVIGIAIMSTTAEWIRGIHGNFDGPWHGYLIATIERRGLTAPWQLVPLDTYTQTVLSPYPYGLHLLAAVADFTSQPNVALNAVAAIGTIVVVPVGAAALAATIFGRRYIAIAFLPIALMLLPAFQLRISGLASYGLGIALMPAAIAFLLRLRERAGLARILFAASSLAAIVVVQPAVIVLVVLAVLPPYVWRLFQSGQGPFLLRSVTAAVIFLVVASPWIIQSVHSAGATLAVVRPKVLDYRLALGSSLTNVDGTYNIPWVLIGLAAVGVVLSLLGRIPRWLVFCWIPAVLLYVVTAAGPDGVRRIISGPFFTDWYRTAPLVALLTAIFAAGALSLIFGALLRRSQWSTTNALIAVSAVAAAAAIYPTVSDRQLLTPPPTNNLTSYDDTVAAYRQIATWVPTGSQVLNDWQDGTTWLYSLEGGPVLIPWNATVAASPDRRLLLGHFAEIGAWPNVDQALLRQNVRSVVINQNRRTGGTPIRVPLDSPYVHLVRDFGMIQFYSVDLDRLARDRGVTAPSHPSGDF